MSTTDVSVKEHHHAHHFDSAEAEHEASIHGVWLFLVTEIMTFAGLFVAYAIFKSLYPEVYHEGHHLLNWKLGGLNTIVLLFSSLTMALSIHYIRLNQPKRAVQCLWITLICGLIFMVVKYFEYAHKIEMGTLPGGFWHPEEFTPQHKNLALFFGLYFCMTGLHGLHVLIGMALIYWLIRRTKRGEFSPHYYTAVEGVGLFWHLVDLVWIYLFPLLYLVS